MFNCGCGFDYDPCQVWEPKIQKARKGHTCCECGEKILPGQRYERLGTLFDGHWATFKTCLSCLAIWADLCGGDRVPGELAEQLWETNGLHLTTPPTDDDGWWGADEVPS